MIKENQKLLNQLNIFTDGIIVFCAFLLSYFIRFVVLPDGVSFLTFERFVVVGGYLALLHMMTYQFMGLYDSFRHQRLHRELAQLCYGTALDFVVLVMALYLLKYIDFSRLQLGIFLVGELVLLGGKRVALRKILHYYRRQGYNQKHVVLVGCGEMSQRYTQEVVKNRELGYQLAGYISDEKMTHLKNPLRRLGGYDQLEEILERLNPDEVVITLAMQEYPHLMEIIAACEKTGVKVSIIPFYAQVFPANPQVDFINDIPMINLRRIPLDNFGNATMKRCMDVVGAALLLLLTSPFMLIVALGVKLSSPGPVFFAQKRVGRNKKEFYMYKFRSMRVNDSSDVAWSQNSDSRKTKFGALIRKCSIDEFPQFFNVLRGDMSLVGPRPELLHFVEQFKEDVPLYMVKHQVRPGITGWAQVNGFRGDTSIAGRIEHDIYYIEHWSLLFDIKILFLTLFKGVVNSEKLK